MADALSFHNHTVSPVAFSQLADIMTAGSSAGISPLTFPQLTNSAIAHSTISSVPMQQFANETGLNDILPPQRPIPLSERAIEATVLTLIGIIALVGNISIYIIVLSNQKLRTPSNGLVLCLCTADILVSSLNMPIAVYSIIIGRWPLTTSACVVFGFTTMLTFVASVMSLATISINRYIKVCHSRHFNTVYTKRNAALFIAGTWVLSVALATPPLVGWGVYDYLPNQSVCFCNWRTSVSYTFFMVGVCFGGPCSVMTFCYVMILREFRRSSQALLKRDRAPSSSLGVGASSSALLPGSNRVNSCKEMESSLSNNKKPPEIFIVDGLDDATLQNGETQHIDHPSAPPVAKARKKSLEFLTPRRKSLSPLEKMRKEKAQAKLRQEMKLTLSFFVIVITFVISWLPFCVTMFISVFAPADALPRVPDMITLLLGYANSCCNPVIYGIMNTTFREGFRQLYCNLCNRHVQENNTSSTSV